MNLHQKQILLYVKRKEKVLLVKVIISIKFDLDNLSTENQLLSNQLKVVDNDQLKEYITVNLKAISGKMSENLVVFLCLIILIKYVKMYHMI